MVYVRYGKFICKVWPIRHGYVMIREYFRKVRQRFSCQLVSTYLLVPPQMTDSKRKCKIVHFVRGFFHSDLATHSSRCWACLDSPFRST